MEKTFVQPYLTFAGRCEEALEFYKTALDAKVDVVMRFNESPDPVPEGILQPGFEDKIMHAAFRVGYSLIMATDGCNEGINFSGFSLSISVESESEVDRVFHNLADGGTIQMPLGTTFWSPRFGMVSDRFGITWMVTVTPKSE